MTNWCTFVKAGPTFVFGLFGQMSIKGFKARRLPPKEGTCPRWQMREALYSGKPSVQGPYLGT